MKTAKVDAKLDSLDFLTVGHITHDIVQDGFILGGPALYSAMTARNLEERVGIITNIGKDFKEWGLIKGVEVRYRVSEQTTTFHNIYDEDRKQFIRGVADPIETGQISADWANAEVAHICPVANEVSPELIRAFNHPLVGIGAQGLMRTWDGEGQIIQKKWDSFGEMLPHANVVVFSEEDIAPFGEKVVEDYVGLTEVVILTRGGHGSTLFIGEKKIDIPAYPTVEVDPTGAGDVFTSAFLIRYHKTKDALKAARFASCVASFVVEKEGIDGIPTLEQAVERQKEYDRMFG